MSVNALIFGALLIFLGPLFYFQGGDHPSATAFIPSIFGVLIAAFGLAARQPARRKAAMHGAAGVTLLGLLGSLHGLKDWPKILTGQTADMTHGKELAAWSTLLMFVLCLIFLVLCVRSFIDARRSKT